MFTILIVEDNRSFREALKDALQSRFSFLALATAAGAEDALAKIDSMRPDLIFMDMRLPDGNGLQLTRRLRAARNRAVVIVLTSHDLTEYREDAVRSGADRFLVKSSANISEILRHVESILASRFRALIVAEDAGFK